MQIEPGTQLGSYEILAPLGAGGMGEVYRARDPKLERDVAIKVLPEDFAADPERLARFEREAKALAALNHPNVATVHGFERDGDTHFLVMELVEGEELAERIRRGPIPVEEAIPLFVQIAEGLEAAHEKGIVHRDLKPANVKVTDKGRVKILDFGLAKALERSQPGADLSESPTMTAAATMRGEILGTAAYMSPEQAQGSPVDARSDIWSFGVCLLEALVGKRVFQGENVSMVMASVLKDEPPLEALPEETPAEVRRVLKRCLTRELSNRQQSIGDARVELAESMARVAEEPARPARGGGWDWRWVAAAVVAVLGIGWLVMNLRSSPSEAIDSLVVLPFETASEEDADAQYLGDGIAESLINQLSGRDDLRVIARTTAFRFRDRDSTPQELGERLEVVGLITGRVQRRQGEINVLVELVDTSDGSQRWGEEVRGDPDDLVALQERITRLVLERLRPELAPAEVGVDFGTANPEAFELQMRASYLRERSTEESLRNAIRLYEEAIALDPEYARAWAGLAGTYGALRGFGIMAPTAIIDPWREATQTALRLDQTLAAAWRQKAWIAYSYDWEWEAAAQYFRRALESEPDSAGVAATHALYLALFDPPRGVEEARRALALESENLYANRVLGAALHVDGELDASIAQLETTLTLDPGYVPALEGLGWVYLEADRVADAITVWERKLAAGGDESTSRASLATARAKAGDRSEAETLMEEVREGSLGYLSYVDQSWVLIALGDDEAALDALEAAAEEREWLLVWLKNFDWFDPLRAEPRFQALIARIGFPEPKTP